jgi:DnaJ-class molecular chaperone
MNHREDFQKQIDRLAATEAALRTEIAALKAENAELVAKCEAHVAEALRRKPDEDCSMCGGAGLVDGLVGARRGKRLCQSCHGSGKAGR